MSEESPFTKLHVEPSKKGDLTGLLEQFNLPPRTVKFIRENQKRIITVLVAIVIIALAWAMYDIYSQKRTNTSGSALSMAMKEPEAARQTALQKVATEYKGNSAALWARVELAHMELRKGEYKSAITQYTDIRQAIKANNPLNNLVTYGIAQAEEADNQTDSAFSEYLNLSKTEGYQPIGLLGMARIHEMKGEPEKALSLYEQYMATFSGQNVNDPERAFVAEKIGRLKALQ